MKAGLKLAEEGEPSDSLGAVHSFESPNPQ